MCCILRFIVTKNKAQKYTNKIGQNTSDLGEPACREKTARVPNSHTPHLARQEMGTKSKTKTARLRSLQRSCTQLSSDTPTTTHAQLTKTETLEFCAQTA
jgi:hypothetical protein